MTEIRMIILKPSAMPAFGTVESALFRPWALVADDTSIPVVLTNHKETHDQLAAIGQQSLLVQFFKVSTNGGQELDSQESVEELVEGLKPSLLAASNNYDTKLNWAGRTVNVVVGGPTASTEEHDEEAIKAGDVPVSVLAQYCRSLSEHDAKIIFKGSLSPQARGLMEQLRGTLIAAPNFKKHIAERNEQLKADLIHADILEAKRQGGMPEATAALDKIMRGKK